MTPLAYELGNALLRRHRQLCVPLNVTPKTVSEVMIQQCTIPYRALCETINAVEMTETVGNYLNELAEWCESSGLPPINSLAVNSQTGYPGTGYFLAPGCGHWEEEVRECVACRNYPPSLPRNA